MDRDQSKHCHHNNHSQSRVSLEFTEPQWNHTTDSCRARRLCQEHEEKLQATLAESVYPSMPSNIFVDTKTRSLHCFWQEPFHPGGCWQGTGFPAIESNHNVFIFEITGLLPLSTKIMWWEERGGGESRPLFGLNQIMRFFFAVFIKGWWVRRKTNTERFQIHYILSEQLYSAKWLEDIGPTKVRG